VAEGAVLGSIPYGWERPHEMPLSVLWKSQEKEQMYEDFVGLDLNAQNEDSFRWVGHPIRLMVTFEKGKKPRQAVQVHSGPSQVMMKFPALGVIHGKVEHAVTKNRKAGLSQANTTRRGENNAQQKQHKGEETRAQPINSFVYPGWFSQ